MQLVLRCGRCSGARGCRCPAALACTCSPLTFALRCNCAAAYFEVDECHHPHRGRARGRLRGGMRALSRRLRSPLVAATAAAGGCQGAWSCEAAAKAPVLAQARCNLIRAAWAVCPRVCGGSGAAILPSNAVHDHIGCCGKKCRIRVVISRVVLMPVCVPCVFLTLPTPLCTRVCVVSC